MGPIGHMIPVEEFRSLIVELFGRAVKWSVSPIGYMIPVEKFRSLIVELLGCAVKWSVIWSFGKVPV
jgi:hypothetical protein